MDSYFYSHLAEPRPLPAPPTPSPLPEEQQLPAKVISL